jgi:hypothetical protein
VEPRLPSLYPDQALVAGGDPFFNISAGVTKTIHVSVLNATSRWRLRTVRLKQGAGR